MQLWVWGASIPIQFRCPIRLKLILSQNLHRINIFNYKTEEMQMIPIIQCFIKQYNHTLYGILRLTNLCCIRFSVKTQFKIEFLLPFSGS